MAYRTSSLTARVRAHVLAASAFALSCVAAAGPEVLGPPVDGVDGEVRAFPPQINPELAVLVEAVPSIEAEDVAPFVLSPGELDESEEPEEAASEESEREASIPAIETLPLGTPRHERAAPGHGSEGGAARWGDNWLFRTIVALGVVIGLIFLARAGMRRLAIGHGGLAGQFGAGGRSPSGLLSVLGRYPISRGQTLVLLKVDRRVLLVAQRSDGLQTLCEITDPEDVASILIKAADDEQSSLNRRFSALLKGIERDPSFAGVNGDRIEAFEPVPLAASGGRRPAGPTVESVEATEPIDAVGSLRRRLASLREGAS